MEFAFTSPGRGRAPIEAPIEAPIDAPAAKDTLPCPSLRVLIADEDPLTRNLLSQHFLEAGHEVEVVADGKSAIKSMPNADVAVVDWNIPQGEDCLEFANAHCEWLTVLCGVRDLHGEAARLASCLHAIPISKPYNVAQLLCQIAGATSRSRALRRPRFQMSAASQQLAHQMTRVAALDSTVLITGESGVGKTTLARQIHQDSSRADAPFIAVNCASLPRELIESELFGHKRGSFTGAVSDRTGRAEAANGGTLLLDEIGDLPLELQPKLLTFLQDHTLQRIGSNQTTVVDVRVIVATHRDLGRMCRDGQFRQDLYYRLNVIGLYVPSLRERVGDIPELVDDCLRRIAKRRGAEVMRVHEQALARLVTHDWPGNIRELENVLERASAFGDGRQILTKDLQFEQTLALPLAKEELAPVTTPDSSAYQLAGMTLAEIERQAILETLHYCGGNKAKSARTLGISEKSIYNKIRRLKITEEELQATEA